MKHQIKIINIILLVTSLYIGFWGCGKSDNPTHPVSESGTVEITPAPENIDAPWTLAGPNEEKAPVIIAPALKIGPNPFNPVTSISYSIPEDEKVSLVIYDVRGWKVATLADGWQTRGTHTVTWDGRNAQGLPQPSGVYLAQMKAGSISLTRRMTLVQ